MQEKHVAAFISRRLESDLAGTGGSLKLALLDVLPDLVHLVRVLSDVERLAAVRTLLNSLRIKQAFFKPVLGLNFWYITLKSIKASVM